MIQIQNDRLHYNWLGQTGGDYPRYKKVRPEFDKYLDEFQRFLKEESLGPLQPNQWEITYVNHLPRGSVWSEPADWRGLFAPLTGPFASTPSATLESLGGQWHFEITPQRGRLHVELRHERRPPPDGREMITMKLTARGPVAGDLDLDRGLNLGHETIVTAFRDLTSPEAHGYWGLYYENA